MQKIAVALVALVACAALVSAQATSNGMLEDLQGEMRLVSMFSDFMSEHGKEYADGVEMAKRFAIFKDNVAFIEEHNRGVHNFTLGVNQFADQTNEEFQLLLNEVSENPFTQMPPKYDEESAPTAASVDWRQQGAVTHVKNQGQCGSCYSFSATGTMEGAVAIRSGRSPPSLSEQQIVDCDTREAGCNGGVPQYVLDYVIRGGGLESEDSYPYKARKGTCSSNKSQFVTTISSYSNVRRGSETDLTSQTQKGPVSVAIDASLRTFQFYKSGVYDDSGCRHRVNHGVLTVGYGTMGSQDYYIVKNSWGSSWGDKGYILMARNQNNLCNIATMAVRAIA